MFGLIERLFGRKRRDDDETFDDVVVIPGAQWPVFFDGTPAATYSTGGHGHGHANSGHPTHHDVGTYGDASYGGDAGI